jgi:glycosyltransferase involved in cell wall biosynthesis
MARILVLASRWPWPSHGGDKVRLLEICRALSRQHKMMLLACSESRRVVRPAEADEIFFHIEMVRIPKWRSYLNSLLALMTKRPLQLAYYRSAEFERRADALAEESDLILAHLLRTAQYVSRADGPPHILEMTDAMSLSLERAALPTRFGKLLQLVYRIERERVRRYERECLEKFDCISVVSEIDKQHLARMAPPDAHKLLVATLAVPHRELRVADPEQSEILFLGNMSTLPNIDACYYFIMECLPQIRAKHPDVKFRIVGPVKRSLAATLGSDPGVIVTGAAADFTPYVNKAFCGVAPMRRGAGIQTKILDYMSFGLPCVTTPLGYEGLFARAGVDVIVADGSASLVAAVLTLLESSTLREQIGLQGRKYVRQHHSADVCLAPLVQAAAAAILRKT